MLSSAAAYSLTDKVRAPTREFHQHALQLHSQKSPTFFFYHCLIVILKRTCSEEASVHSWWIAYFISKFATKFWFFLDLTRTFLTNTSYYPYCSKEKIYLRMQISIKIIYSHSIAVRLKALHVFNSYICFCFKKILTVNTCSWLLCTNLEGLYDCYAYANPISRQCIISIAGGDLMDIWDSECKHGSFNTCTPCQLVLASGP